MYAGIRMVPQGYGQLTGLSSAKNLPTVGNPAAIPSSARIVAVLVAEAQAVRWRDDGVDPDANTGMLLPVGVEFTYTGPLSALRVIETTMSAKLNVSYYKVVG